MIDLHGKMDLNMFSDRIYENFGKKMFNKIWPFVLKMKDEGRLNYRETVLEGIENSPKAFLKLFSGEYFGKILIKVNRF